MAERVALDDPMPVGDEVVGSPSSPPLSQDLLPHLLLFCDGSASGELVQATSSALASGAGAQRRHTQAGAAAVAVHPDTGRVLDRRFARYAHPATSVESEFLGVALALQLAHQFPAHRVTIHVDNAFVVNSLRGTYSTPSRLYPFYVPVLMQLAHLRDSVGCDIVFLNVDRCDNAVADRLARVAASTPLPDQPQPRTETGAHVQMWSFSTADGCLVDGTGTHLPSTMAQLPSAAPPDRLQDGAEGAAKARTSLRAAKLHLLLGATLLCNPKEEQLAQRLHMLLRGEWEALLQDVAAAHRWNRRAQGLDGGQSGRPTNPTSHEAMEYTHRRVKRAVHLINGRRESKAYKFLADDTQVLPITEARFSALQKHFPPDSKAADGDHSPALGRDSPSPDILVQDDASPSGHGASSHAAPGQVAPIQISLTELTCVVAGLRKQTAPGPDLLRGEHLQAFLPKHERSAPPPPRLTDEELRELHRNRRRAPLPGATSGSAGQHPGAPEPDPMVLEAPEDGVVAPPFSSALRQRLARQAAQDSPHGGGLHPVLGAWHLLINRLLSHSLPPAVMAMYAASRLVALPKKGAPDDVRPISIASLARKVSGIAIVQRCKATFRRSLAPLQFGVSEPNGAATMVKVFQHCFDRAVADKQSRDQADNAGPGGDVADPLELLSLDVSKAFNTVSRTVMLQGLCRDFPSIRAWLQTFYGPTIPHFVRMPDHSVRTIQSTTGALQGCPLGSMAFSHALSACLRNVALAHGAVEHTSAPLTPYLQSPPLLVAAYVDDVTVCAPRSTLEAFVDAFRTSLRSTLGLHLNLHKTHLLSPADDMRDYWSVVRGHPVDNVSQRGVTILGAPVGTLQFRRSATTALLQHRRDEWKRVFNHPLPAKAAFQLLTDCVLPQTTYDLRLLSPESFVRSELAQCDRVILQVVLRLLSDRFIDRDQHWTRDMPAVARAIAALPHAQGGFGLRSLVDLAPNAFLAATMDSLAPFFPAMEAEAAASRAPSDLRQQPAPSYLPPHWDIAAIGGFSLRLDELPADDDGGDQPSWRLLLHSTAVLEPVVVDFPPSARALALARVPHAVRHMLGGLPVAQLQPGPHAHRWIVASSDLDLLACCRSPELQYGLCVPLDLVTVHRPPPILAAFRAAASLQERRLHHLLPRLRSPVLPLAHDVYAFCTRTELAPHDTARADALLPHCSVLQSLSVAFLSAFPLASDSHAAGAPSVDLIVPQAMEARLQAIPVASQRQVALGFHYLRQARRRQHMLTKRFEAPRLAAFLRGAAPFQDLLARAHLRQLQLPGVNSFLRRRTVPGFTDRLTHAEFQVACVHSLGLRLLPENGLPKYCLCHPTGKRCLLGPGHHLYYCSRGGHPTRRHDTVVTVGAKVLSRVVPSLRFAAEPPTRRDYRADLEIMGLGERFVVDVSITHAIQRPHLSGCSRRASFLTDIIERKKTLKHAPPGSPLEQAFCTWAFTSFGGIGKASYKALVRIACLAAVHSTKSAYTILGHLVYALCVTVAKGGAQAFLKSRAALACAHADPTIRQHQRQQELAQHRRTVAPLCLAGGLPLPSRSFTASEDNVEAVLQHIYAQQLEDLPSPPRRRARLRRSQRTPVAVTPAPPTTGRGQGRMPGITFARTLVRTDPVPADVELGVERVVLAPLEVPPVLPPAGLQVALAAPLEAAADDLDADPTWTPHNSGQLVDAEVSLLPAPAAIVLRIRERLDCLLYRDRVMAAVLRFRRSRLPRLLFARRVLRRIAPRHWQAMAIIVYFGAVATRADISEFPSLNDCLVGVVASAWRRGVHFTFPANGVECSRLTHLCTLATAAFETHFTSPLDRPVYSALQRALRALALSPLLPLEALPRPLTLRGFRTFAPLLLDVLRTYVYTEAALTLLPSHCLNDRLRDFVARRMVVSPDVLNAASRLPGAHVGPRRSRSRRPPRALPSAPPRTVSMVCVPSGNSYTTELRVSLST